MKKNVKTDVLSEKQLEDIGDMLTASREKVTDWFDGLANAIDERNDERATIEAAYQSLVGTPMPPRVQEKNMSRKRSEQLSALRNERDAAMVKAVFAVVHQFGCDEWAIRNGRPRKN